MATGWLLVGRLIGRLIGPLIGPMIGPLIGPLFGSLFGLLAGSAAMAHAFDQAEIRQPRASFVDVPALSQALRAEQSGAGRAWKPPPASDCAAIAQLPAPASPMVIPGRYVSGGHGALRPDYDAAVALYRDFETRVASLANQYLAHGDKRYAQCLLDQLALWATADALSAYTIDPRQGASNQAWFQSEWSIAAAALALSQVVHEPTLDAARLDNVIAWLHRASLKQISYPGGPATCCNNHAYWRGLQATMVGVLANDRTLFRWGLGRYALAIDHLVAVGGDAQWPLEMSRKELALHYHNFALLPLVMMAEIAAQQGLDLYGYQVEGRDLHSAVRFVAKTWHAPASWPALGLIKQDLRAFTPGRSDQAWAEFYRARFGRDPLGLLDGTEFNARTGGQASLLTYRESGSAAASTSATQVPTSPTSPAAKSGN